MKSYEDYKVVQKFPVLKAYMQHFQQTSLMNDLPGLLSFFMIQGQVALPYVRIPTGDSWLDPRVHVFWIQPSRTGKSVAWNFVGDVLDKVGVDATMFSTGTDAGLVGSFKTTTIGSGKEKEEVVEQVDGLLAGKKALNFDEGSILLIPNKHSQETVLYLQTACNPVGSGNNVLVKHMKDGTIECESLVSLWITTYPPKGVKEYVLTKGIFQRVLLYWAHWDMDMRQTVSNMRLSTFWQPGKKTLMSREKIYDYFKGREKLLRDRLLNLSQTPFNEWDAMTREDQEDLVQNHMWEMFTKGEDYTTALFQAADEIYDLVRNMDPALSEVVASFTPGVENYLGIISLHIAILDESWVVTGEHVDLAHDLLFDLFRNLISWLEDEVEVGMKEGEKAAMKEKLRKAYDACATYELDGAGDGWRRKASVITQYMAQTGVSKSTADRHMALHGPQMFNPRKHSKRVYIRMKGEGTL